MSRRAAGTLWEDRAAGHLCDHGLEPVARNFHSRFGEIDLIIGTHALIQDLVDFKDLGLVVIDEQHRFGVAVRMKLAART